MPAKTKHGYHRPSESNLQGAPLFLQPNVVAGVLDIALRPAKRMVEVPVLGKINGRDKPKRSKSSKQPKTPAAIVGVDLASGADTCVKTELKIDGEGTITVLSVSEIPPSQADSLGFVSAEAAVATALDLTRERQERVVIPARNVGKTARMEMMREIGARLKSKDDVNARLPIGGKAERAPLVLPNPAERLQRCAAAIRFLQRRGIGVTVVDRDAQIREYWVSDDRNKYLAGDIIAKAQRMGWEG